MNDRPDLGTFGRYHETPVAAMQPDMKSAYEFTKGLRGLVPGPHRIWVSNPTLCKTIVPTGDYYQKYSTLTKPEIEIVTNTITARWSSAYASFEHEQIAEEQGKIDPNKVQRLVAGLPVSFDDPREQVIYEVASALVVPRPVSFGLFKKARGLIGDAGICDVAVLIGWFTMVSMTLAAYDVPANADSTALDQ